MQSFDTRDEAIAAGFVTIAAAKTMLRRTGLRVRDTSGYNFYGYSFAIKVQNDALDEEIVAVAETVGMRQEINKGGHLGAYGSMFRLADVEAAIAKDAAHA